MASLWLSNLLGTFKTSFGIGKGKATIDAGGLTAARTFTLQDIAGLLAVIPASPTDGSMLEVIAGALAYVPIPALSFGGRLYATSGTPYPTADATAIQTVYYGQAVHDKTPLYDGTRWRPVTLTEQTLNLTAVATGCNLAGTSISGIADTSQLVRGMQVTGTGIPANTTISSISTNNSLVVNNTMTTGSSITVTFKLPPSTAYDVFGILAGGTLRVQFGGAWTNSTTRSTSLTRINGVLVNSAAINASDSNGIPVFQGVYLGSIYTTGTAGQTSDAGNISGTGPGASPPAQIYVYNQYNPMPRNLFYKDTGSHTYNSATIRQWNGSAAAEIQLFLGQPQQFQVSLGAAFTVVATGNAALAGLGVNSTTTIALPDLGSQIAGGFVFAGGVSNVNLAVGLNTLSINESGNANGVGMTVLDAYLAATVML